MFLINLYISAVFFKLSENVETYRGQTQLRDTLNSAFLNSSNFLRSYGQIKFFHHNDAPDHRAKVLNDYLANTRLKLLKQSPPNPNLAPRDFVLFPLETYY